MKELQAQLVGKGKSREEGKGCKLGKGKGKRLIMEEREKNVEKKTEGKGGAGAVKGKEEWRGKPYRVVEEDGFWWVPISHEEWGERRGKETYRCKEGGWWTKMQDDKFEEWQFMRDRRGDRP